MAQKIERHNAICSVCWFG